jgi:uncharacterized protein YndB with AHSA1/START domain
VTHDLKIERLIDAPPEIVFDTIVNPDVQDTLFTGVVEGWGVRSFDIDLRVGGSWVTEFGPLDGAGEPDRITSVFTEVNRPRRLSYRTSMYVSEWGRTVDFTETITFDEQDGKTLLTVVESGFETEADRDSFLGGVPDWVEAVARVAADRAREGRR